MTCRQCGTEIAERAIICYRCGTPTAPSREGTRSPVQGRRAAPIVAVAVMVAVVAAGVWLAARVPAGSARLLVYAGLASIALLALRVAATHARRRR